MQNHGRTPRTTRERVRAPPGDTEGRGEVPNESSGDLPLFPRRRSFISGTFAKKGGGGSLFRGTDIPSRDDSERALAPESARLLGFVGGVHRGTGD